MSNLSRKPTSGGSSPVPSKKFWEPKDRDGGLLTMTAVCCCTCRQVVGKDHVVIKGRHVFCPDHQEEALCSCQGDRNHHFNVDRFIEKHEAGWCCGGLRRIGWLWSRCYGGRFRWGGSWGDLTTIFLRHVFFCKVISIGVFILAKCAIRLRFFTYLDLNNR